MGSEDITEACFVMLLASGMCLTLSSLILLLSMRVWREAKDYFDLAWDLAHPYNRYTKRPEVSD